MTDRLVKYHAIIPAPPAALEWIAGSFRGQIARIPCGPRNTAAQTDALMRMIQTGNASAVVAVPRGHSTEFSGWAVGTHGALMFAYVRKALRLQGIGLELIGSVTSDDSPMVRCAYWTSDADGMSRHGIPVVYDVLAYQALLAFIRGPGRRHNGAAVAA